MTLWSIVLAALVILALPTAIRIIIEVIAMVFQFTICLIAIGIVCYVGYKIYLLVI